MECHQGAGHKGGKASRKKAKLKQVPIDDNCVALSTASPSQATISQCTAKEMRAQYICTSSTNTVPHSSYPPPPADATYQQPHYPQPVDHLNSLSCSPIPYVQQPPV